MKEISENNANRIIIRYLKKIVETPNLYIIICLIFPYCYNKNEVFISFNLIWKLCISGL